MAGAITFAAVAGVGRAVWRALARVRASRLEQAESRGRVLEKLEHEDAVTATATADQLERNKQIDTAAAAARAAPPPPSIAEALELEREANAGPIDEGVRAAIEGRRR